MSITKSLLFITLCAFLFAFSASLALAQGPAASACDPDYYKSLKAKAWMEAQREITQNQNLIYKPDSVLEYTCFDKHLGVLSKNAGTMFSENPKWGGVVLGMEPALKSAVALPLESYLTANFTHTYLGGRGDGGAPNAGGIVATPGDYDCAVMNDVWQQAKCKDFIDDPDFDGFFTLEHYVNNDDKRQYPVACIKPTLVDTWQGNYEDAVTNQPWEKDPVEPKLSETFYPPAPVAPDSCKDVNPIPTGVEIYIAPGLSRPEKVCVMPGCYYDSNFDKCCAGVGCGP